MNRAFSEVAGTRAFVRRLVAPWIILGPADVSIKGLGCGDITVALWWPFGRSFGRVGNVRVIMLAWLRLRALRVMGYDLRKQYGIYSCM